MHYAVQDLEELLSDTILRAYTASIQPGQIVRALHEIAAQGALQPLQYIEKSRSVERQVHDKIKQMQAIQDEYAQSQSQKSETNSISSDDIAQELLE